jgi:hypothetical protein
MPGLLEIYLELVLAPLYNLLWKKGKQSGKQRGYFPRSLIEFVDERV